MFIAIMQYCKWQKKWWSIILKCQWFPSCRWSWKMSTLACGDQYLFIDVLVPVYWESNLFNCEVKDWFHTYIYPEVHNAKEMQEGWLRELWASQQVLLLWDNNGASPWEPFLKKEERWLERAASTMCHAWPSLITFCDNMAAHAHKGRTVNVQPSFQQGFQHTPTGHLYPSWNITVWMSRLLDGENVAWQAR